MSNPRTPRAPLRRRAAGFALAILAAALARADWDPADPAKWVQLPDLSPLGMDVQDYYSARAPLEVITLADDWKCVAAGPVTNIHVWGSWENDVVAPGVTFTLAVHADIPAAVSPTGYSMPGPVLWWRTYTPGAYTARTYAADLSEWYFDPLTGRAEPGGDHICFQYNFPVGYDPGFSQAGTPQEPVVYWLEVQASYALDQNQHYGWKSSSNHWNDCAVFAPQTAPYPGQAWSRIVYPALHPLAGQSVDLAFVIEGGLAEPQLELDFGDAPEPQYPTRLASDGARHLIATQGPFLGAGNDQPDPEADGQPDATATGDDQAGASPDDENGVSIPALTVGAPAALTLTVGQAGWVDGWIDWNGDGDWSDANEQVVAASLPAGVFTLVVTAPGPFVGQTFARFRIHTGTSALPPSGPAADGEVEDYSVTIRAGFGPKWQQPPDLDYGLDIPSWRDQRQAYEPFLVADDWWCDGRPIDAIRWWGSYLAYGGVSNAPGIPEGGLRPAGFRLHWYTDIPAANSPAGHSTPGAELLFKDVPLLSFSQPLDRCDVVKESYAGTLDLGFLGPAYEGTLEHKFLYELILTNSWNEKAERTYWLGIEALYEGEAAPGPFPWGWSTTSCLYNWNDDAVVRTNDPTGLSVWGELTYLPQVPPYAGLEQHPYLGRSVNMAYELLSRVTPRRAYLWRAPPDLVTGTDLDSWRHEPPWPGYAYTLRAGDWLAEGRRVSDVHWWGSYLGWATNAPGSELAPVPPPPAGAALPLGFNLSWHADAAGVPGAVITNLFVPLAFCHETYYCCVTQSWVGEGCYEHEYQYYVDLLDPLVSGVPWNVASNTWYWLDIQALFSPDFEPGKPHAGWGWKTAGELQEAPSALLDSRAAGWVTGFYPPGHPLAPAPADLAFELTTDQVGTNRWHQAPVIVAIVLPTNTTDTVLVAGVGDVLAGVQQLRMEPTTLTNATFGVTVDARPAPFPPPATNWFRTLVATNLTEFYRIYQVGP